IATYGNGIHFFKGGKIINHLTMADGLAGDLCRKVFVDSSVIYVATNQGFSYFNYQNNHISDIKTITISDGIVSNDIKDICARGNNIYLATSAGLCIVNKNISQSSAAAPPVYITSVSTRDVTVESFEHLKFDYNTDFNLNYIAITFEQPDKISYAYNTTGNEKDWMETKNTSISFSSLSPGNYTFQLRAKKYNSDWSKATSIHFSIIPPFWQQWWFRLLFFSALAGTIYYLLQYAAERRYRIQLRLLKEKQALADERSRISSDMHDDLGADLSNLLLMTRITGQTPALADEERSRLNKLEAFATGLVGKVDEIIWALNPRNDTLSGMIYFIQDYALNIAQLSSLESGIHMPDDIPSKGVSAIFRRNIFLVVKEALNNIVRHSRATGLAFEIRLKGNNFELMIEDNGNGFNINSIESNGDGLLNMKKRIEEVGGTFEMQSDFGVGSKISIVVPLL
ncbi:MAG: triple tyrosine motif-containing protein, partial [Chitinophagales bacterium]